VDLSTYKPWDNQIIFAVALGTQHFCWDFQQQRWKGQNALHLLPIKNKSASFVRVTVHAPFSFFFYPSSSSTSRAVVILLLSFFFLHFSCRYGSSSFLLPPLPAPLWFFFFLFPMSFHSIGASSSSFVGAGCCCFGCCWY